MEHLELIQVKFLTGLIRMRRTSDTKITLKKKLHKLKRIVSNEEDEEHEKMEETHAKFKFLEMKQSHHQFCGLHSQYNKYYLMLKEMRQGVVKNSIKEELRQK
jgi:hypothetical protein